MQVLSLGEHNVDPIPLSPLPSSLLLFPPFLCSPMVAAEIHDNFEVLPTTLGRIAGHYYLSHKTVGLFHRSLKTAAAKTYSHEQVLTLLCDATEYDDLPVRHNEELLNAELMRTVPWPVRGAPAEAPSPVRARALFSERLTPSRGIHPACRHTGQRALARVAACQVAPAAAGTL